MDILRYYRHDVMNDLQIVQAYSSMGKLEKVEEKIAAYMVHFDEERKLMNLNAPNLALWLIPFNSIHPNFRFTYAICDEKIDISEIDEKLTTDCKSCIKHLQKITDDTALYEGKINVEYSAQSKIQVQIILNGTFGDEKKSEPIENNIVQQQGHDKITCTVTLPWDGKGEKKCL